VKGDAVGHTLFYGRGAGAEPTASAVVADLVDVTRMLTSDPEHRVPHLAFQPDHVVDIPILPIGDVRTAYYLRLQVLDRPGVVAEVSHILAEHGISIRAMTQKVPPEGVDTATIILLTREVPEREMLGAIAQIEELDTSAGPVTKIRLEELGN
jgi:homoserine dehydrogenase